MRMLLLALLYYASGIGTAGDAWAHEWYPLACCSDRDCAPIKASETPREEKGGFTLVDGRHVAYKALQPSPDGLWHLCETQTPAAAKDRHILCIFAPIGGT